MPPPPSRYTLETKGRATVGFLKGESHPLYEDRFRLLPREIELVGEAHRGEIFAVFDGMGGLSEGMHAAQHMADLLVEFFAAPAQHPAAPEGLARLLERGSHEISAWGCHPISRKPKGGCAGTVAWLTPTTLHLYHAGDTEAWLSSAPGHAVRLTRTDAIGHALVRFFGRHHPLEIVPTHAPIQPGTRLLLTSDGLRNAAVADLIPQLLETRRPPREIVAHLCERALANGARDDVTVLLVLA